MKKMKLRLLLAVGVTGRVGIGSKAQYHIK